MTHRVRWFCGCLALLLVAGCSPQSKQEAHDALDYGTGKTQVDTYQSLKRQIHAIQHDETQQNQ